MDNIKIRSAKIVGVTSCIPSESVDNIGMAQSIGIPNPQRTIDYIGIFRRRVASRDLMISDLAVCAINYLLDKLNWDKSTIDGILLITQTPDRKVPATACHLHRRLDLNKNCFAFDINLGCSAYPYGLWIAQQLMDGQSIKRILLVVGDMNSLYQDNQSTTSLLFGDAATATALEMDEPKDAIDQEDIVILGTDGSGEGAIEVDHCLPYQLDCADEIFKKPVIRMDGPAVASFALRTVPTLIRALDHARYNNSNLSAERHDYYLLHQANAALLTNIGRKAGIDFNRLPINTYEYGNTASASIPLLITTSLAPVVTKSRLSLAMIGFGTGLSWSAISKEIGPLVVADTIEYQTNVNQ